MTNRQVSRVVSAATLAAAILSSACAEKAATFRVVDIKTSDSVVLKATLFAAAKPGPAVLLLHQCDEQRKVWDSLGVKLMNAGITALSVDYRGFGESGGASFAKLTPSEMTRVQTDVWPADIDSAYAFLLAQPNVDATKIGLGGGSCGADNAAQLATRKKNIKALAFLAGGVAHAGRVYVGAPDAPPIFVGAAADDKYANFVEIMGWLAALSTNKQSRIIEYPDGGHAALVFNKHPAFADSIANWFAAVLLAKPELLPTTNGKPMNADVAKTLSEIDGLGGAESVSQKLAAARRQNPTAQLFPEFYANV
ncbi:MAG: acyl-CoA thioester hydrolase/BAAT C-terminal domain-containing protein, partial [Gemmatimonadaceae bacterium]